MSDLPHKPNKHFNPQWLQDPEISRRVVDAYVNGLTHRTMAAMFDVSIGSIERFVAHIRKDEAMFRRRNHAKKTRAIDIGRAEIAAARPKTETPEEIETASTKFLNALLAEGGHATISGLIMLVRKKYPAMHDLSQEAVALGLYDRAKQGFAA